MEAGDDHQNRANFSLPGPRPDDAGPSTSNRQVLDAIIALKQELLDRAELRNATEKMNRSLDNTGSRTPDLNMESALRHDCCSRVGGDQHLAEGQMHSRTTAISASPVGKKSESTVKIPLTLWQTC